MDRVIRCECGFVARGEDDDSVIETIREHMREDHPALLEEVEPEDIRSWIEVE